MASFAVILAAAGQSSRFSGHRRKKPFVDLKGRAVWIRAADHFLKRSDVCQTILVIAEDDFEWFHEQFRANIAFMDLTVVTGGATRADSVRKGLSAVRPEADYIAVHDAARPILTDQWIDQVFRAAVEHGAAIPGLKITSTLKQLNSQRCVESTPDRDRIVMAQTPQVFRRQILEKAYAVCRNPATATDDSSVVEQTGAQVHVVDGWPMNLKITTGDDFRLAELYLNALPKADGLSALHPFQDEKNW
jgi:2-C-methyl-D-erythritol 4-phosphate cytidylyltransferase